MTAIVRCPVKSGKFTKSRHFSVTTNSYTPFYATDLYGFNTSYKLEVFCINICCIILVLTPNALSPFGNKTQVSLFSKIDDLKTRA